ncbi:2'-5' RNA ligase [candidate division WOR-3 bacterium RBG_13_43_14]|uniref:RNA 2',3'-cyclic phosphodiesterase n=1 Tax=candidate division WOR-3 bacterium RBG_13_43_14 TaxID=1802590 RepID=A0A1F4UDW3_UNCW3|nr:MAG: 2'-5' RNA ligase [candidate division WOR-3 bacterium RBG_13_43_14]
MAVEITESARKSLAKIVDGFRKKNLPVKWVKPQNMHITTKFLGDIDESMLAKVQNIARGICHDIARFDLRLSGLGCFPRPSNPRIVWVGIDQGGPELSALVSVLEGSLNSLGFKQEERFHPHLTIGRTRQACRIDEILKTEIQSDVFCINNVVLFESILTPTGPMYKVIEKFDLAAI